MFTVSVPILFAVASDVTGIFSVADALMFAVTRVSPFVGFLKHREEQLARQREDMDAVCSGYWRGGYEIALEGEEDEVSLVAS